MRISSGTQRLPFTIGIGVGVGAPLSGPPARLGTEMVNAVQLAVDERNEARTLSFELEAFDDKSQVEKGEIVAKGFCERRDILGVVGHNVKESDITFFPAPENKAEKAQLPSSLSPNGFFPA